MKLDIFSEENCYTDPKGKVTVREVMAALAAVVMPFVLASFVGMLCGCSTGLRVVASSDSTTSLGDIKWDDSSWPIVLVTSGPRSSFHMRKDQTNGLVSVECWGSVTNETHALGMYDAVEQKEVHMKLGFSAPK